MLDASVISEASRQLAVCNACRYCEGYCAVFPALEHQTRVDEAEITLLANLCHDCGACVQACMYTSPHEFAIDIRTLLAEIRPQTYRAYASPARLKSVFAHARLVAFVAIVLGVCLSVSIMFATGGGKHVLAGHSTPRSSNFYSVISYKLLVAVSLAISAWAIATLAGAYRSVRRAMGVERNVARDSRMSAWWAALSNGARLTWLGGGGGGCFYPDPEQPTNLRRVYHHVLVYGLGLAFAATVSAAVYQDILGLEPPFSFESVPVVLGMIGGCGVLAGAAGLIILKHRSNQRIPADAARRTMDYAFLAMLVLAASSGMALLLLRSSGAMGSLLIVHVGIVYALYLSAPYGKFVHAVYRLAALAAYHQGPAQDSIRLQDRQQATALVDVAKQR